MFLVVICGIAIFVVVSIEREYIDSGFKMRQNVQLWNIFTARRHASAVYAVVVCLSVCHELLFYRNG